MTRKGWADGRGLVTRRPSEQPPAVSVQGVNISTIPLGLSHGSLQGWALTHTQPRAGLMLLPSKTPSSSTKWGLCTVLTVPKQPELGMHLQIANWNPAVTRSVDSTLGVSSAGIYFTLGRYNGMLRAQTGVLRAGDFSLVCVSVYGYRESESSVNKAMVHAKWDCRLLLISWICADCSSQCPGRLDMPYMISRKSRLSSLHHGCLLARSTACLGKKLLVSGSYLQQCCRCSSFRGHPVLSPILYFVIFISNFLLSCCDLYFNNC